MKVRGCIVDLPLRREARVNGSRFIRGVTAPVHARQALAEYIDRSVVIGVHFVTAMQTGEARLALAAPLVDRATGRAGLRGVGGIDFQKRPAALFQFIEEQGFQAMPPDIEDGTIQTSLLGHLTTVGARRHSASFQVFKNHSAELTGDFSRCLMLPISANAGRFCAEARNALSSCEVAARAALSARHNALCLPDFSLDASDAGKRVGLPRRQRKANFHAPINPDCGEAASLRRQFAMNSNAGEPIAILAYYAQRLQGAVKQPSVAELHPAEFGDIYLRPLLVQRTGLGVRCLNREAVASPHFPKLREPTAAIEGRKGPIQVAQGAMKKNSGRFRDPRHMSPKLGDFPALADVIEHMARLAAILPKIISALFKREVVEISNSPRELAKHFGLRGRWIQPIFVGAEHMRCLSFVPGQINYQKDVS